MSKDSKRNITNLPIVTSEKAGRELLAAVTDEYKLKKAQKKELEQAQKERESWAIYNC